MSRLIFAFLFTTTVLHAERESLFNGKTLDGWEFNPKIWRVEDGIITGGSTTEKIKHNDFISTKRSFQNFDLRLKIKCSGDPKTGLINSGIQIRSVRVPGGHHMSGYQVDCGKGWFGKIYDEFRRNKVITEPLDAAALQEVVDVYGWNEYRILAEGPRIQVWINGVHAIDYTESNPNIALDGHIGPQVHGGGVCLVQVKDVTIEELPSTPGAPTWKSLGGIDAARAKVAPPKKAKAAPKKPKRDISYNDVQGQARTAAEQLKLFTVPEGYEIELVAQEDPESGIGKFISVYFDQQGRMWAQTGLEYPVDANENPAAAEAVYARHGKDKILVYPREALNAPLPAGGLTDPTVFADGLAIPLGILPWGRGDSCYALHGHDLKLLHDTDEDGVADKHEIVLTGFGVQDSHLFPHQFTRAPGGWIWMAQGLFNNSAVKQPGSDEEIPWPKCSMARMRPDGGEFEVTSTGPNNIWGLAMTAEGETFIQEANDYGYPVMPFHEYAYYPGGMAGLKKSYQPDFPAPANFRMGGTGLSGLALLENGPSVDPEAAITMLIANPIISKVQTLAMFRTNPGDEDQGNITGWRLEQRPDFITCSDPFYRPVAMTQGPDGAVYIVDWYNKIISHNEVPRNHPDRDKTRGRIWRVKPKGLVSEVPDFTQMSNEELAAMLGQEPSAATHLAWQTLADRETESIPDSAKSFWAFDPEPRTERERIKTLGRALKSEGVSGVEKLLEYARPSLPGQSGASTRGKGMIPVRESYDREFERFLVRMFLERNPDLVNQFLDSEAADTLPIEARLLAALSLEPEASASRVAALLPQLDRVPNTEEFLRLARHPEQPGVGEALQALIRNPATSIVVPTQLLSLRTSLDPAKIAPLLSPAVPPMLAHRDPPVRRLAFDLIAGFQLVDLEDELVTMLEASKPSEKPGILAAMSGIRSGRVDLFAGLVRDKDPKVRQAAIDALAASSSEDAPSLLLGMFPELAPVQRQASLTAMSSSKSGAKAIVAAILDDSLAPSDLDGPTVERIATVLGDDPAIAGLQVKLGGVFRPVLMLNGKDDAWVDSKITLEGPFTVECWVRLVGELGNEDTILGEPSGPQFNFFRGTFRVYAGPQLRDVAVASKPMTPDLWTHIAVTRDAKGICRIYQNGELDATASKPAPATWNDCRIAWSGAKGGTQGAITEFRVWNRARSAQEIRNHFDRILEGADGMKRYDNAWGKAGKGTRVAKTIDTPPLLTEEQAKELDAKFARFSQLGHQGGNPETGKVLSALCTACHQIGNTGGQIGPNLSGVGSMGMEAILRNILTPNAAMEAGYRIFRVETNNGDLVDAFYVSEDNDAIIVRQPGAADRRIPKQDIVRTQYLRRSLMPEGLLDSLPDQQVADLLAYLMTLKG
jgi:putative heme-binding domain-containing protein